MPAWQRRSGKTGKSAKIFLPQGPPLPAQSAIGSAVTTITRTITVAAGVFAPGHLGELIRIVPFELTDAVLAENRAAERRLRMLPSRVGIYFVLALGLFPRAGYLGVWAKLTAALEGQGLASRSAKALRDLRRRLGAVPLKALFEVLAGPLGQPRMPGMMFGRYRTVAFDGCRPVKVPDTPRNRAWPSGKPRKCLPIAKTTTAVHREHPPAATRPQQRLTTASGP
jgi:hypothetical protein